ncbi:methylthioribose-1-phosphate isomerase [Sphaerisporangium melleum]|uniref:Methylthioribose-1-phosphate isomerase n=1 Tax=Sphaerisporangium melleum TaxID=321316 RepID=A0A917R454_9ACTN|nr:methylthioribose-1-phosphate isomerase [Sphaerisporangium melleum]GGK89763.1 methylthioribose-1-phosphate isomerase [Sphaerisporangium melleum]GII72537.1 methylthioribose-1-phosphate isomerase [Sphaerisporangium melleum]
MGGNGTTPILADSVRLTGDGVDILDRRVYPFERRWVHCATLEEVAVAIERMVTQSHGPLFAATAGLVLAAREARHAPPGEAAGRLRASGRRLVATRPTNHHIRDAVTAVLAATADGPLSGASGEELLGAVAEAAAAYDAGYREGVASLGRHAADLLDDGARVLTHCWGDAFLIAAVQAAERMGKRLEFVCTETRPYLQGARLTTATLVEMGYEPTLITDGMVPSALADGLADVAMTASDRVTMDGHVVNKVGTLAVALAARAFGAPMYVLAHAPDPLSPGIADVEIEHRDGEEVLHVLGTRTAAHGVRGYYPAFDATPPHLVTRIVTERGAFEPSRVADHFSAPHPAGADPGAALEGPGR